RHNRSLYLLPQPIAARTAATSRSLPPPASSDRAMDVSEKADRLQSRVQDLDAEPANNSFNCGLH
ncbi:MAG: hypothetical protein HC865_20905, partial [Cyanobacteria bacterium RU_5_0]|nr:hypothetical protein [Cyanobacteria bacterium RU_5_0]